MKKIIGILFISLLFLSSCEKYLDINQNPNDATTASVGLVLPSTLTSLSSVTSVTVNYDYAPWMGYWAHADGWSGWYDIKQYRLTSANQSNWFTYYNGMLMDLTYIEKNATAAKDIYYKAIAKTLKAMIYQMLVDIYGDVPYSQACTGNLAPVYDDAQKIYEDLVIQLDSAVTIIKTAANANAPSTDIMFSGDMTKWKQLANTLKLRILLRQSQMTGRDVYIKGKLSGLTSSDFLSADALVNPGFTTTKPQFYYSTFGWTTTGALTNAHTQYVMNAYIEKVYNDLNDPRKARCFAKAIAASSTIPDWHGKPFGLEGDGLGNPWNKDKGNLIGVGLQELNVSNLKGALVMPAFESYFLQAEAVQRGWLTGDVKSLYENGVKANFAYLGLTSADATAYLANGRLMSDWSVATNKLTLILYQKYIAFCGINGLEAWSEYRRTGIPDPKAGDASASMLSYNDGVSRRQIPTKMHYPTREFTLNSANVLAAAKKAYGGKDPDDKYHFDSKVFWDVN